MVNEGGSFMLTIAFYDEDGDARTPGTLRYKIHCLTNNRSIRSWTTLTPGASVEIAVTHEDNVILTDSNRLERRQLQVQTDYDTDDQSVSVHEWDVRNLA